ncbi:MAG: hypothetical protein ACI4YB_02350, partial [Oscillospiraceae bacterium]
KSAQNPYKAVFNSYEILPHFLCSLNGFKYKPFYRQVRQIEFCQSRKATAARLAALQCNYLHRSLTKSEIIIAKDLSID